VLRVDPQHKFVASPYRQMIASAMQQGVPVYIRYSGGSAPGTVRAVVLTRWISEPSSFEVHCMRDNIKKKYFLSRVVDARKDSFE
jgi:hypothetical protein